MFPQSKLVYQQKILRKCQFLKIFLRIYNLLEIYKYNHLNFINCACKFTDSSNVDSKRLEMKQLIYQLESKNPNIGANIFKSSENVNIETVLGIKKDGKKVSFLDNYDK